MLIASQGLASEVTCSSPVGFDRLEVLRRFSVTAMGCLTGCCKFLVLIVAVIVGYWNSMERPIGPVFAAVFTVVGMGKPKTEAVPDDLTPAPRPSKELFLGLPSGAKMPANGLGMCCRPTAYDPESVYRTVLWYLLQGGRHIDTADIYGNHVPIGKALKEAQKRGVPRKEVFLTTKVFPDDFGYDATLHAVDRMLKELDQEYIDLILLHAPRKFHPWTAYQMYLNSSTDEFWSNDCRNQVACRKNTWKALSELRASGVIGDAGVSNFRVEQMQELQSLNLAPIAVHQIQYHPWIPPWQQEIVDFCHAHKIAITAYFSLGGIQTKDRALSLDDVKAIAKKYSRSSSQVLLRWALEKNVSVIPGTGNPHHMKENLGVYDLSLNEQEIASINALKSEPIADDFFFFKW
ncbi:unnamed protein product [Effrenium voratum]|nr:unnamed protein product [Effrenium voratum]